MFEYVDRKYISLISGRLKLFKKQTDNQYNFRCPFCGDSQRDKHKKRGYLIISKGTYFKCHNCGIACNFSKFLEHVDPLMLKEYDLEIFREKNAEYKPAPLDISKFITKPFIKYTELKTLKTISQLPSDHPAKLYVIKRQIPSKHHYKLFYAPKFKQFVNQIKPRSFVSEDGDEPRLVIPLVDKRQNLIGLQGRSFAKNSPLRYITIILDPEHPKVFGLDSIDPTKKIYVVEGPIDSLFLPNAIAMAGAFSDISRLKLPKDNVIIVFDNEKRNREIAKLVEQFVYQDYNVCLWPDSIQQKDINDMVLNGMSINDIVSIIDTNTFRGLEAQLRFCTWSKL